MDPQSCTVASLADLYVVEASAGRHKADGKPKAISSMYNERRAINRSIKPLVGDLLVTDLTTEKMQEVVDWTRDTISKSEALVAKLALSNLSHFACYKHLIRTSAALNLKTEPKVVRKLPLTDETFRLGWSHVEDLAANAALPVRISANALLLMISTLQAPTALVEMKVADIDIEAGSWLKPVVLASGETWIRIPLSSRSLGFIRESRRHGIAACGDTPWVFPAVHRGFSGEKPIDEKTPSVMMRRTTRAMGMEQIGPQQFIDTGEVWLRSQWTHPEIVRTMLGRDADMPCPDLLAQAVASWDGRISDLLAKG